MQVALACLERERPRRPKFEDVLLRLRALAVAPTSPVPPRAALTLVLHTPACLVSPLAVRVWRFQFGISHSEFRVER